MTTQTNDLAISTVARIDSLTANEFFVEVDGEKIDGIFRVTGLVAFKLDVRAQSALKALKEPFKITRMVRRDPNDPFNRWLRESTLAKADIVRPTRTVDVVANDGGTETRRWSVKRAWISEISYSDFNTGSGELVEETITIQYEEIEDIWPQS